MDLGERPTRLDQVLATHRPPVEAGVEHAGVARSEHRRVHRRDLVPRRRVLDALGAQLAADDRQPQPRPEVQRRHRRRRRGQAQAPPQQVVDVAQRAVVGPAVGPVQVVVPTPQQRRPGAVAADAVHDAGPAGGLLRRSATAVGILADRPGPTRPAEGHGVEQRGELEADQRLVRVAVVELHDRHDLVVGSLSGEAGEAGALEGIARDRVDEPGHGVVDGVGSVGGCVVRRRLAGRARGRLGDGAGGHGRPSGGGSGGDRAPTGAGGQGIANLRDDPRAAVAAWPASNRWVVVSRRAVCSRGPRRVAS